MKGRLLAAWIACVGVGSAGAWAQHEGHHQAQPAARSDAKERLGDPYPFRTCPISGMELGSMGEPPVKVYEGREVRFCCAGCFPKFERDLAASFARLDEKTVKDQAPLYPLKTSVVSGKPLPEKPIDVVVGNRLVRLAEEGERATLTKEPRKYLKSLDEAVVAAQKKDYPLTKCPVSGDALEEGAVDVVIAGRLIRLCCEGCREDIEKTPARFIEEVDKARKSGQGDRKPAGGR